MKLEEQEEYFLGVIPSNSVSWVDYPEPSGHCVSVYFVGCRFHCRGCQNEYLQKEGTAEDATPYYDFVDRLKDILERTRSDRVCLLGGDPLFVTNRLVTRNLIRDLDDIHFCVYTGETIENAIPYVRGAEYVKCGVYDSEHRQTSGKYDDRMVFASTNQKLYDSEFRLLSENGIYYYRNRGGV